MPSPFPGMDPYLEEPALWPSVHHRLITYMGDALTEMLPARYVANINERVYIDEPDRSLYPDAFVLKLPRPRPPVAGRAETAAGVIERDPPWVVPLAGDEIREGFLEIMPAREEGRVITVIELLSPSNKAEGSAGWQLYRAKQRQVLTSPTHLLEIDFLRRGAHVVAVPRTRLIRRGPYDYLVSLSRGERRDPCEVWGIPLRKRLPRVSVPLADGDPDVVLDLQSLFDKCYDAGGYVHRLDYSRPPLLSLSKADAEWADALLRREGLRTKRKPRSRQD